MESFGTLGPKMKAFLVVDGVLLLGLLVALVLFVTGSIGGSGSNAADPSSASTKDTTSTSGESTGTDTTSFASPSRNIECEITDKAATCRIANSTETPTPDASCDGVVGLEVTVTAEGASKPCVEGDAPTKAAGDLPELAYGQSKTVGDFTCTSLASGMSCQHDPSGKGFKVRKAGSELF